MNLNLFVAELLDFARARPGRVQGSFAGGSLGETAALSRAALQGMSDLDILNFALTLEHLEAAMYEEMLAANVLTGKEQSYFQSFGSHESAHVDAITKTIQSLGGTPVARLADYKFPSFANRGDILNFAKTAEDIGVGAYQGAAAAIQNADILAAAGSIVQVEARHAAVVNRLLGLPPVPKAFTDSLTVQQVLDKVNPILGQ